MTTPEEPARAGESAGAAGEQAPAPEQPPGAADATQDAPAAEDLAQARRRRRRRARVLRVSTTVVVALLGMVVGVLLVPDSKVEVGPLTASVHLRPSLSSDTVLLLPPVGEVAFDTHIAPVRIEARVKGVDIEKAEALFYSDAGFAELQSSAPEAISSAAARNAALNALFAAGGAGLAVGITFRRVRRALVAGGGAVALVGASVGTAAATFSPDSLTQPRFDGLLSQAAYIADLGEATAQDYASYRDTLAEFVGQVSALYIAADSLPVGLDQEDLVTVLHVSDIHDNPQAYDVIEQLHTDRKSVV